MPGDPDLDDVLRAVWTRRRPDVLRRLDVVEEALADALEGGLGEDARDAAERAAHQIAGSAGTFGFDAASAAARGIEHALRDGLGDPAALLHATALVAELRAALEASGADAPSGGAPSGGAPSGADDPGRAADPSSDAGGGPDPGGTPVLADGGVGEHRGPAPDVLLIAPEDERTRRLVDALAARGLRAIVVSDAGSAEDAIERPGATVVLVDTAVVPDAASALAVIEVVADELPTLVVDRAGLLVRDEVTLRGAMGPAALDLDVAGTAAALADLRERRRFRGVRVTVRRPADGVPAPLDALRAAGLEIELADGDEDVRLPLARTRPELLVLVASEADPDAVLTACRVLRNDPRWWRLPLVVVAGAGGPSPVGAAAAGADDHVLVEGTGGRGTELAVRVRNRLERSRSLAGLATDPLGQDAPASGTLAPGGSAAVPAPALQAVETVDVVLVEDDPTIVALLEHALTGRGLGVRHFGDGLRASAALAGTPPEVVGRVVLLDWDLPGVDGLRVLRSMGANGALEHSRVIMLTARAGEHEVLQALESGATDHVAKPFSLPVLLGRVAGAMRR
jgi:DNA-binding response OmpR family regulator/HPt (histidine-containing phosphotransfer) domain-containing protein